MFTPPAKSLLTKESAKSLPDTPEVSKKADELLSLIQRIIDIQETVTLIIEDPFGNSAISSSKVVEEELTTEEAENLKCGMYVLDLDEDQDTLSIRESTSKGTSK